MRNGVKRTIGRRERRRMQRVNVYHRLDISTSRQHLHSQGIFTVGLEDTLGKFPFEGDENNIVDVDLVEACVVSRHPGASS